MGSVADSQDTRPSASLCYLAESRRSALKVVVIHRESQCLKWSKKEAGSLPQYEVECPLPNFLQFIFYLKMASFDALLVVFYAI